MTALWAELPLAYWLTLAGLFGLAVGSFLNVVIQRVPRGLGLARPASRCPQCETPLRWRDNIPLFSYFSLGGRCRTCRAPISWQYPVVELGTSLCFIALVWQHGAQWMTLGRLFFAAVMIALCLIDARHHLLPDVITHPLLVFGLAYSAFKGGWGASLVATPIFDLGLTFGEPLSPSFAKASAMLWGALIFLSAVPVMWLIDWLDMVLFDRFFEYVEAPVETVAADPASPSVTTNHTPVTEIDATADFALPPAATSATTPEAAPVLQAAAAPIAELNETAPAVLPVALRAEQCSVEMPPTALTSANLSPPDAMATDSFEDEFAAARWHQRTRVSLITLLVALLLTIAWIIYVWRDATPDHFVVARAYQGLQRGALGALVSGGVLWVLRALHFVLRKMEGMGLGDIKMMAGVGAFFGSLAGFSVVLYGSVIGALIGLIAALYLRARGETDIWQAALPLGSCLALAALAVLFQG